MFRMYFCELKVQVIIKFMVKGFKGLYHNFRVKSHLIKIITCLIFVIAVFYSGDI